MTVEGYNEEIGGTAISRSIWTWARLAGGAAILAVLVWRVGAGPFVDGLRLTTAWALAAAMAITSLTTLCCAGRWSLPTRIARAVSSDLRGSVLSRRTWPGIVLASTIAVMGHVAVFMVAVQVTGTELPAGRLLPLALVVLLASAVPANIAGWGPREGAAAWAFGAVGLSAAEGVTVAVVYGVLALVATLPGAVMLVAGRGRSRDGACELTGAQAERVGGVVHA
jgi:hypothetical protein